MKPSLPLSLLALSIQACSTPLTPQQIASAEQLANSVIDLTNLKPAQKQAALQGVAAVAQGYVGMQAPPNVLAQSAGNVSAGQAIVDMLPATAMSQAQVNQLWAAANKVQ